MSEEQKPEAPTDETKPTGAERLRRGQKPAGNLGRVPALDDRDLGFGAKTVGPDIDEDIDKDLDEAMGGMSMNDLRALYGEARPKRAPAGAPQPSGKKKGKVISVRGKDVFVDVGGRTQGVLPTTQFPEGLPKAGDEVEVTI